MVCNGSRTITHIAISLYPDQYMLHSLNRDIHLRTVGIHKHSQWTLCKRDHKHTPPPPTPPPPSKQKRKSPALIFSFLCEVFCPPLSFCLLFLYLFWTLHCISFFGFWLLITPFCTLKHFCTCVLSKVTKTCISRSVK